MIKILIHSDKDNLTLIVLTLCVDATQYVRLDAVLIKEFYFLLDISIPATSISYRCAAKV